VLRTGLIGVGKMGISHLAIAGAHPDLDIVGICDSQGFVLSSVRSQTGIETYKNFEKLIDRADLDCVFVATPSATHAEAASYALQRGVNVFVEKPLTLSHAESARLAQLAAQKRCANQVGYHNRFIGTFREVQRLVAGGAIGTVHHIDGEAFGPVVTKARGGGFTWRSRKSEGGGCLHDYACHVIDLMNFVVGPPQQVIGARMTSIYSKDVEDAVHALFAYPGGATGHLETNWSDESHRKMSTSITVSGSQGKIYADRQECRVFLKPGASFEKYEPGWTVRYITELQAPVAYYLRGEEYSAQVDSFAAASAARLVDCENSFASAAETDRIVEAIARMSERVG
jgi:scyllo-inositol 2-dehydrogenase (NADP+)